MRIGDAFEIKEDGSVTLTVNNLHKKPTANDVMNALVNVWDQLNNEEKNTVSSYIAG